MLRAASDRSTAGRTTIEDFANVEDIGQSAQQTIEHLNI